MRKLIVAASLAAIAILPTTSSQALSTGSGHPNAPDSAIVHPAAQIVTPQCGDGCGGGGDGGGGHDGGGGCNSGCGGNKGDRPGHGYGDKNHDHTGPPGQDGKGNCSESCYDW